METSTFHSSPFVLSFSKKKPFYSLSKNRDIRKALSPRLGKCLNRSDHHRSMYSNDLNQSICSRINLAFCPS